MRICVEERAIATKNKIALHAVRRFPRSSARSRRPSIAVAVRTCHAYLDWHPLLAGVLLTLLSTMSVGALFLLQRRLIPLAGGWAVLTPLNGAMLAVLLKSRRKLWPFLLLGYLAASGLIHLGPLEIFGNLIELLLAAFTLPPYRSFRQWMQEPRLLPAFAGYALLLGPAIMCLTVAHRTASFIAQASYWDRAWTIGFSESLGIALGTSLMLVLCNRNTYRLFRIGCLARTTTLLSLIALATWIAFTQTTYPAIFLPCAALVLVALRLGIPGAVLGTALASAIICALTALHTAATVTSSRGYLALTILVALPLGVTVFKRIELEDRVKEYQAEIDRLKSLDRLTGIANRKRFDLVLSREWQRATRDPKPIALLMVDTDFFDLYNEHYGTQAGDECLRLIAARMSNQPHRQYDLVSRFDGGSFSVLLPGAPAEAVKRIGEEIRAEIAAMEWPHERSQFGRVTVSVGWASMTPGSDLKQDLLISAAEAALETAKRKGRNRVEGFSSNVVEMIAIR